MGTPEGSIRVEVAYAQADRQVVEVLEVPAGTTAAGAVRRSGLLERFPAADPERDGLGIFGARVAPERRLEEGDRVEIYRPLQVDPKAARRLRALRRGG